MIASTVIFLFFNIFITLSASPKYVLLSPKVTNLSYIKLFYIILIFEK